VATTRFTCFTAENVIFRGTVAVRASFAERVNYSASHSNLAIGFAAASTDVSPRRVASFKCNNY